jgi:hypothetical protein
VISDDELAIRRRLKDDFNHYSSKCLSIRTKSGGVVPFVLNDAQKHIHEKVEEQRASTGKVRAIILKGRQQGCSTYVEGRLYWRVTHSKGVRAFILTQEEEATNNLFDIATRYHENCPSLVKPSTGAANAKELYFNLLDSGYKVGTAGNKAVGRSSTIQFFHGSEVAFWPNAQQHAAGILQAIPDGDGTEIFLESTANGIGNYYHQQWQAAESGQSDYIAIFVPWFWQPEYTREAEAGFSLTEDETAYRDAYGLSLGQMAWRRNKILQLKDENLFKQEYPATAAEAFQVSGADPYIKPETVIKARKCNVDDCVGAKVLGVDPARFGADRTAIGFRQGRKAHWIRSYSKKDVMEVTGIVKNIIDEIKPDKVFIDVGGLGAGVYDRLCEIVDKKILVAVNFGERPLDAEHYVNKRAEMWGLLGDWLKEEPVDIPDDDELQADLTQVRYGYDSNGKLKLESKDDMKKRGFRSPDKGDSLALTFAQPVSVTTNEIKPKMSQYRSGGWMR